jgi:acetoacetyl-CoA reductase
LLAQDLKGDSHVGGTPPSMKKDFFIETEMYATIPGKVKEAILQRIPLGRVGTPQEVARAIRYLIVDGDYITGQTLSINGGIYM